MRLPAPSRRLLPALVLALAVAGGAAGCGSYSDPAPETGIDGLEIPTPVPDPADFVAEVDNPWFVLDDASYDDGAGGQVRRTVAPGPTVLGVATTTVTLDGQTDLYAQDVDGNVWWFGRAGEWEAGESGAEAGLVMPAEPRVGDGFRRAEVPGRSLRAQVLEADGEVVVLAVVGDGTTTEQRYGRDVGLEAETTTAGEVLLARRPG
ncbi:hypothetical protein [Nocardioides litoris]|uniref:hypothetical protein n=1 Tax=Nocardioides litoris TaxID=1926648 RepID=UPI0011215073|nr:hypothetical protein [Nocardioides litoris]